MPVYEFICLDCREKTEVTARIEEKEKGLEVACPSCGGGNMAQYFGNMTVTAAFPLH